MTASPPGQARIRLRPGRWLLLLAAAGIGCNGASSDGDVRRLHKLEQENLKLKSEAGKLRETIAAQGTQIKTLQALGSRRLEKLFYVTSIKLGRYTGGVNLDGKEGDDGIRVYLIPQDADGHTLKAAGHVRVQLFDLAAGEKGRLIATCEFAVETIGKKWAGGFLTKHYKFDCPWKSPPGHAEITVRASFTDYLTGKEFTAQKVCKVDLPPAGKPKK